ncbi:MAG: Glycosyltransferase involved in cell wall bisynthesis [Candidatus Alkanophagales archaeon MCA70_species_2]|nr:Glycosyltransferase involved in cell wall bisynthesis [Candidatus Alkanophaga liquidiphilum]
MLRFGTQRRELVRKSGLEMRIAMFSWESLHSIKVGGVAVHVTELAAALERLGNEVHVFTRMGHGQPQYEVIDRVHYHRCPFDLNSNFVGEMNNMCRSFAWHFFETENIAGHFDIIHGHDWMTANALAEIKNARGKRTVFTLHSTEYGRCGNAFHEGQSWHIRNLEWYGGFVANKIITTSQTLKEEIKRIYKFEDWKIAVIPNGVSLHKFDVPVDPWEVKRWLSIGVWDPVCLFVGRMVVQKGPDLLLEAVPSVLIEFPDAKFVFIGDGHMRPWLERRAWELGVAHATRFLGYVSEDYLGKWYKACDVVCIPSRNEPFGIVALEAWAARKPIIVTQNGFEYVKHGINGLRVYDNPQSISWGIKEIFSNFEHARRMGENGRKAAKFFSWDNVAKMTLGVYSEILA